MRDVDVVDDSVEVIWGASAASDDDVVGLLPDPTVASSRDSGRG